MNEQILQTKPQEFINQNLNADISKLIFKGSSFFDITIQELAEQIEAKKKSQYKLPSWFFVEKIYYPNKLNIEQTSSEITANYKANLIKGTTIIDLTGGFGVDAFAFSNIFNNVTHCEINQKISAIAKHNFKELNIKNIQFVHKDGIVYLKEKKQQFDWIYIDPSRRNDRKEKVILLKDCEPNVRKNIKTLFKYSHNIMVKVSPMLDISSAISELIFVKEVHVIALQNEVKELLFLLEKGFEKNIKIKTVNIKKETTERFDSVWSKNTSATELSKPLNFLYEPNSAILKAGLFNEVSCQLNIPKLNINSHLYTSNILINFSGRRFAIKHTAPYNLKKLKKVLMVKKANIATRNFPDTVAQIRKKTKIREGGNSYLFFTKDCNEQYIVLICEKV